MVHVFADPASPQPAGHTPTSENGAGGAWPSKLEAQDQQNLMSREEHAQWMKEIARKRGLVRTPRRGWSMTEYQGDVNTPAAPHTQTYSFDIQPAIPENSVPSSAAPSNPTTPLSEEAPAAVAPELTTQLPRRPKLGPPRRSYSVTDYEPAPLDLPKPSHRLHLLDLPSELHYAIVDFLDPIDSVCFGLAHHKLYDIHRRKHGSVPLSSRYNGPNDMEWAWRGAGPLRRTRTADATANPELGHMRVQGQMYCRKCGVSRCELHRHIKEWMGPGMEYCEIRATYGPRPGEDAKAYCFMKSPKNPNRCGRHGEGKSSLG